MALAEEKPGFQAPGFDFTAYICWDGFRNNSRLKAPELDPDSSALLDAILPTASRPRQGSIGG
jgi:hypothetical protein